MGQHRFQPRASFPQSPTFVEVKAERDEILEKFFNAVIIHGFLVSLLETPAKVLARLLKVVVTEELDLPLVLHQVFEKQVAVEEVILVKAVILNPSKDDATVVPNLN